MKRTLLLCLVITLVLFCSLTPSFAQTHAFIPHGDNNVTRLDTTDEVFDTVALPESSDATDTPYGAAVTNSGVYLLVTRRGDLVDPGTVTLIMTSSFLTGGQTHRDVGVDPRGVAVESRDRYAYVANFADDTLSRINMATLSVSGSTIPTGAGPFGVAAIFDEVDDIVRVYVTNNSDDSVSVITDDGVTADTDADDIAVGTDPVGIAITPDGDFVYVANNGSDSVTIIQTSDHTVVKTLSLPAGAEPWGVAVGSDGDYVYVTNSGNNTVSVIAASTQSIQDTFGDVDQPMGVAAAKNGDFAIVVNQGDDSVTRIEIDPRSSDNFGSDEISNASALGAFVGGTPPSAPSALTATEKSFDEIELAWTDNSDDESGFKIERREDEAEGFTQIAKVGENVTTYSDDEGLADNTTYHYRVRAFNEAADSEFASEANALTEEGSFSWCFIQTLLP